LFSADWSERAAPRRAAAFWKLSWLAGMYLPIPIRMMVGNSRARPVWRLGNTFGIIVGGKEHWPG
jgi:hypothetical protein